VKERDLTRLTFLSCALAVSPQSYKSFILILKEKENSIELKEALFYLEEMFDRFKKFDESEILKGLDVLVRHESKYARWAGLTLKASLECNK